MWSGFVATCKTGLSVKEALEKAEAEINSKLQKLPGRIVRLRARIEAGPTGALVFIGTILEGHDLIGKRVVCVNARGTNPESALRKAEEELERKLKEGRMYHEIADFHFDVTNFPIPARAYTTLIVAINEPSKKIELTTEGRRERLRTILELVGGDISALNVSGLAKAFGVSRNVIYNDLKQILGTSFRTRQRKTSKTKKGEEEA